MATFIAGCAAVSETALEAPGLASPQRISSTNAGEAAGGVLTLRADALNDDSEVVCRDMLLHASNILKTRCMSRKDWKTYERVEAMRALQIVRRMQGSAY
jgi:hypothetical protein